MQLHIQRTGKPFAKDNAIERLKTPFSIIQEQTMQEG